MRRTNSSSGGRGKKPSTRSPGAKRNFKKASPTRFGAESDSKRSISKGSSSKYSTRQPDQKRTEKGNQNPEPSEVRPFNKKYSSKRNDSLQYGDTKSYNGNFSSRKSPRKKFDKMDSGDAGGERRPYQKSNSYKQRKSHYSVKKISTAEEKHDPSGKIRLNKYISNSGVCSRREADQLIQMGLVSVNGKVVTELGFKVNPTDEVRYEEKILRAEKPVYILLNKPKGYLTTTSDPQERDTVMHLIGGAVKERVYPVGRLDRNTTGLLLITNDGDLADKLSHPSYNVKKIYKVELDRALTKADYQKIRDGIVLEEGRAFVDDLAIVSDDGRTVGLEIHIGWNRVVRRIFESLNYDVLKLDRSVYAGLDKKELPRGKWRFLRKEEIIKLKHFK